jgi:DNA-binding winged helix-turn-helix (wHTH) protein
MIRSDIDNPSSRFEFGRCQIDRGRGILLIDGREVPLRRQTWLMLDHLARNAGQVVGREALFEAAWPGMQATDDMLAEHIEELRRAFGDHGPGLIVTTPGGFRFEPEAAPPERRGARGPHPLRWRWNYGIFFPLATAILFLVIWWLTRDAS